MISKPRKSIKTRKRNPDSVLADFNSLLKAKKPIDKRKFALSLRKTLSDDKTNYWKIISQHVNFRKEDIDRLITQALVLAPGKVKNPIKGTIREGEVIIKHRGNVLTFDEEDAETVKDLIRKKYSNNDEVIEILK